MIKFPRSFIWIALSLASSGALVSKAKAQVGTILGAPSTCAHTFNIDFVGGSDSASGTRANPWKRQPFMAGWSGSYHHTAGDCFIFKGGVTWDHTALQLEATAGGSSSASDYYGVDQTWYTGQSWTRPILDCQSNPSCGIIFHIDSGLSYITVDSLELRGVWAAANVNGYSFYNAGVAGTNIIANNLEVHNWRMAHGWSGDSDQGGIYFNTNQGTPDNTNVQNSLIHNEDGGYMAAGDQSIQVTGAGGSAAFGAQNYTFNEIHDVSTAIDNGGMLIHDNYIHDTLSSWDSAFHTNTMQTGGWQLGTTSSSEYIYRNRLINVRANQSPIAIFPCFFGAQSLNVATYVYDNVITGPYNYPYGIDIDPGQSGCGNDIVSAYIFNNTVQLPSGDNTGCGRITARPGSGISQVVYRDNQCISDTADWSFAAGTVTASNNITETNAVAASLGYTAANNYAPPSGQTSLPTAGKGVSVSSVCPSCEGISQDINLVSRASLWDVGAYEAGAGTAPLSPPTGLAALVH